MQENKSIISSQAKLSAIAGMMFFPFFIKNNIKLDHLISEDERNFIYGYIRLWYFNLTIMAIVVVIAILNFMIISTILPWIITIWCIIIFCSIVFSLILCINNVWLRMPNESLKQDIQYKNQISKYFVPIINFFTRYRQQNYDKPYRWLKESIFFRTIFIWVTMFFWTYCWLIVLWIILSRFILLLVNIDIIPLSVKKILNSAFYCNPEEIFAYLSVAIITKWKKSDYDTTLQQKKEQYEKWQKFWISIVFQYAILLIIMYLIYNWESFWRKIGFLWIAFILWVIRLIVFYINKKMFLRIPIISEFISIFIKI